MCLLIWVCRQLIFAASGELPLFFFDSWNGLLNEDDDRAGFHLFLLHVFLMNMLIEFGIFTYAKVSNLLPIIPH